MPDRLGAWVPVAASELLGRGEGRRQTTRDGSTSQAGKTETPWRRGGWTVRHSSRRAVPTCSNLTAGAEPVLGGCSGEATKPGRELRMDGFPAGKNAVHFHSPVLGTYCSVAKCQIHAGGENVLCQIAQVSRII